MLLWSASNSKRVRHKRKYAAVVPLSLIGRFVSSRRRGCQRCRSAMCAIRTPGDPVSLAPVSTALPPRAQEPLAFTSVSSCSCRHQCACTTATFSSPLSSVSTRCLGVRGACVLTARSVGLCTLSWQWCALEVR